MLDVPIPISSLRCLSNCPKLTDLRLKSDFKTDYAADMEIIKELEPTWHRLELFSLCVPSNVDSSIIPSWLKLLSFLNLKTLWLILAKMPNVSDILNLSQIQTFGLTLTSKASDDNRTNESNKTFMDSLISGLKSLKIVMLSGDGVVLKTLQFSSSWLPLKGLANTKVLYHLTSTNVTDAFRQLIVPEIRKLAPTVLKGIAYFNSLPTAVAVVESLGRLLSLHIDDGAAIDWILQMVHSNKTWSSHFTGHAIYALLLSRVFCHSVSRAISLARGPTSYNPEEPQTSDPSSSSAESSSSANASSSNLSKKPSRLAKNTATSKKRKPSPSEENHWLVCDLFWQLSLEYRHRSVDSSFKGALSMLAHDEDLKEAIELAIDELSFLSKSMGSAPYQLRRFSLMQFICLVHFGCNCVRRNRSFIVQSDKIMKFLAGPWRRHCPSSDNYLNNIALRWVASDRIFCERLLEYGFLQDICDYVEVDVFTKDITTPTTEMPCNIASLYRGEKLGSNASRLFAHRDECLGLVLSNMDSSQVIPNAGLLAKLVLALPRFTNFKANLDLMRLVSLPHVGEDGDTVLCRALQSYMASPYHTPSIPLLLGALKNCEHCRRIQSEQVPNTGLAVPPIIAHFAQNGMPVERVPILLGWLSAVPASEAHSIVETLFLPHLKPTDPLAALLPESFLETAITSLWEGRGGDFFPEFHRHGPLNVGYYAASSEVVVSILAKTSFFHQTLALVSANGTSIPGLGIYHALMLKPTSAALLMSYLLTPQEIEMEDCVYCTNNRADGTIEEFGFYNSDLAPAVPKYSIAHILTDTPYQSKNPPHRTEDTSGHGILRYRACCLKGRFLRFLTASGCSSGDYEAGLKPLRDPLTTVMELILHHFFSRVGDKKSESIYYERMCDLAVRLLDASEALLSSWQHSPFVLPALEYALSSSFDKEFLAALIPLVRKSVLPKGCASLDSRTASRFPPFIARILRNSRPDCAP